MVKPKRKSKRYRTYNRYRSPCFRSAVSACGNFVQTFLPLIPFMGESNTDFLTGIADHSDHYSKNGEVFFSGPKFEEKYGVNKHYQDIAIEELSKCGLLKQLEKRGPRNTRYLQINETACFIFVLMINNIKKKEDLHGIWKLIMNSRRFRWLIARQIKRIEIKWGDIKLKDGAKQLPKKIKDSCDEFTGIISDYFYDD